MYTRIVSLSAPIHYSPSLADRSLIELKGKLFYIWYNQFSRGLDFHGTYTTRTRAMCIASSRSIV